MNYKHLLIFIIIICIFIVGISIIKDTNKDTNNDTNNDTNKNKLKILDIKKQLPINKPLLWFYWENMNNKRPGYIDICIDSIYKNCSNTFHIIKLDENNIHEYLPEIKHNKMNFNNLKIAQKVDFTEYY